MTVSRLSSDGGAIRDRTRTESRAEDLSDPFHTAFHAVGASEFAAFIAPGHLPRTYGGGAEGLWRSTTGGAAPPPRTRGNTRSVPRGHLSQHAASQAQPRERRHARGRPCRTLP